MVCRIFCEGVVQASCSPAVLRTRRWEGFICGDTLYGVIRSLKHATSVSLTSPGQNCPRLLLLANLGQVPFWTAGAAFAQLICTWQRRSQSQQRRMTVSIHKRKGLTNTVPLATSNAVSIARPLRVCSLQGTCIFNQFNFCLIAVTYCVHPPMQLRA